MSIERKKVIDSIANFQLQDNEFKPEQPERFEEQAVEVNNPVIDNPIDPAFAPKTTQFLTANNPKFLIVIALVITLCIYGVVTSIFNSNSVVKENGNASESFEISALKNDVAQMQQTMNSVLEKLETLSTKDTLNQQKQQQIDLLINDLSLSNGVQDSRFAEQLATLTVWQKEYQAKQLTLLESQKRQLANLSVDIEKLNKDAVSHNYANKFINWQADVDTIKEQQVQINNLLLALQKEYIKLNQYQMLNKTPSIANQGGSK